MAQFLITGPDGKKYKVTGDNAEGALNALKSHLGNTPAPEPQTAAPQQQSSSPMSWSDVPQKALENTPESAYNFGAAMAQPFMHPIDTARSLNDMVGGAVQIPMRAANKWLSDKGIAKRLPEATTEETGQMDTARAVANFYATRYGTEEGFKQALATDPVGVLGDFATLLTGGELAAVKTLGAASKTAKVVGTMANATNPLTVVEKAAKIGGKGVSATSKALLGMTTGTSSETIGQAYRAGRKGGQASRSFKDNMRGYEPQEAVVGEAKDALRRIGDMRDQDYRNAMISIKQNRQPIPFQPVEKAFQDVVDSMYVGGHQIVSDSTVTKLKDIGAVVDEWSKDPAMHTAEGLDALKRRIDDLMPAFSELNGTPNKERAVTATRNAVKDAIVTAVPEYADAMKGYETASQSIKEIEQALSLGRKNSADTALRKLQSITRNNANTNYGSRVNNANLLERAGADKLIPRLAGQSLNTVLPRGVLKALLGGGAILGAGTGVLSPAVLAALPFASPRLIGEAANALGTSARYASKVPTPSKNQLLLLRLLGNAGLLGQQSPQ